MRRGDGLRGNLHLLAIQDLNLFDCTNAHEFVELIEAAFEEALARHPHGDAVKRLHALSGSLALGNGPRQKLQDRRQQLIIELGVSEATVRKWEREGAQLLLAHLLDRKTAGEVDERPKGIEDKLDQIQVTLSSILEVLKVIASK